MIGLSILVLQGRNTITIANQKFQDGRSQKNGMMCELIGTIIDCIMLNQI